MKIKIVRDGKETEIECKNPKGKHTKKGFKLYVETIEKEDIRLLNKYLDYLDELTAELTGMKVEELDELDTDEKNKLVSFYQKKIEEITDFMRPSLKSGNLEPKKKE